MSTSEKYRRHAIGCLHYAQRVNAPEDRALFTEVAAMWLRWADRAELMTMSGDHPPEDEERSTAAGA
jgi:hypothetical protein